MIGKKQRDYSVIRLLIVLIAVFAMCSLTKGKMFLSTSTFRSMGKQFPEYGILAIAMSVALFTGGIDLSIVYTATMSSCVIARLLPLMITETMSSGQVTLSILLSFAIAIAIGALCGAINGTLISVVNIPPILATLGTQSLFQGVAVVITGGSTISGFPDQLSKLVTQDILGIPTTVYIFAVCALIVWLVLEKTKFGYQLRMLGTNSRATTFAGLSNVSLYIRAYMMSGMLAAVSGIIMIGRFNSAKADYGATYTMQSILIAVLGTMDPNGGKGSIAGVIVAVVIVQMLSSWLNMYENISIFYRQIIWGVLLIVVLIINFYIDKRKARSAAKK